MKYTLSHHIHESNLIENIDDPEADRQSLKAWRWLASQTELNKEIICELQKHIVASQADLSDEERGRFRTAQVTVDDRSCPEPFLVPHLMANWLVDYRDRTPLENHIAFEKIHPFRDGNGRTGRMLMWWQEVHNGEEPTLFYNHDKSFTYYPLFA